MKTNAIDLGTAPLGATYVGAGRTTFRVWAPRRQTVEVELLSSASSVGVHLVPLEPGGDGIFSATVDGVGPGARYLYRLDGSVARPDPRSRFQLEGVHGPSMVVDPGAFPWHDAGWKGVAKSDLVIYELHIGTFTPEGTFRAAIAKLDELVELGITAIELMPVAQAPGRWNWGYDGVDLFAVNHAYGTPDDLRALVDAAHARGLGVLLDVVYNHVGPEGNYLADFGPYPSPRHHTPWGDALNFDDPAAGEVRRFAIENSLYWLREYHLDGLRLDAVHFMHDHGPVHVLDDLRRAVAKYAASLGRHVHLIAETNMFDGDLLATIGVDRPPYDAIWCDDFPHALYATIDAPTKLTHRSYVGAADLAEILRYGYVYEGAEARRVAEADRARVDTAIGIELRRSLVVAVQTHDIVGNDARGRRLHQLASPAVQKTAAALALLSPSIPLIFMGEETANSSPFPFFTDFEDERLRRAVERGRRNEYPSLARTEVFSPIDPRTFERAHLGESDDPTMRGWYRDLLAIRREWTAKGWLDPARLEVEADVDRALFVLRYRIEEGPAEAFVVVRLVADDAAPVTIAIEGERRLDSADPGRNNSPTKLVVDSVRAIVGHGTVLLG